MNDMPSIINQITKYFSKTEIFRMIKFAIAGGSGIFVNMFFLWFFHEIVGWHYLIASIIAIALSIQNNFFWNYHWTFADRKIEQMGWLKQLGKFHISVLTGILANWLVLWLLHSQFNIHYLIANAFGIGIGFIANYLFSTLWVFKIKS